MSNWNISYFKERKFSPLSYWVHIGSNKVQCAYSECNEFHPEFPKKVISKGYPYLFVKVVGFDFEFASILELNHCLDILKQRNLPTTISLSEQRGTGYGPNNHWLSRLPSKLKSWTKREKIISALYKAKEGIKHENIKF